MDSDQEQSCYHGETAETLAWRAAELEQQVARLKEKSDHFTGLLKSTPAFIFTLTRDFQITYLNHSREDCFEQPTGMYVRDFLSPEDAVIIEAAISKTFDEQKEQVVRSRSQKTGRMMQNWYAPLKSSSGPPLVVGFSVDVTEEHHKLDEILQSKDRIAEELAESDRRFEEIVETTPVPVVISDMESGQVLFANRALAEFFATPYETIREQRTSDFYVEPLQRKSLLERAASDQPVRGVTLKLKNSRGEPCHAALYLDRITFAHRPALLAFFLDVSAHKRREEEILRDRRAFRHQLDIHERDRRLIAYEIHDGVVQDMTGALMFLQTGAALMPADADGQAELRRGTQLLSHAIGEIRRLINGLRPLSLENGGVVAAIDDIVSRMMEEDFAIDFQHAIELDRLAPSIEMAIYRTVQEAINNARRHSQAAQATVSVIQQDKSIQIIVRDEGRGFDPTSVDLKRYGLSGMHERASLLGGTAQIISSPGQGTLVKVVLPLEDSLEQEDLSDSSPEAS